MNRVVRPEIWGVLNVTPDSFSDGGRFDGLDAALAHADQLIAEGADVIDVGGESTRPGAARVSEEEELSRVLPVVTELVSQGLRVSVDTMRASTAAAVLEAGVHIINDVSGGLADAGMLGVISQSTCDYVLMHWRGHSDQMDSLAVYGDVVKEVSGELKARLDEAERNGVGRERIIVDPGLGFAKKPSHNWAVLARLDDLAPTGTRVIVGASRKRFLGELLPTPHQPEDRDGVSAALGVLLAEHNVFALRVHNVKAQRQALDVWQAFSEGGRS
ncbi:MAG: dihydropteroate synthase [Actinomycetota bacterium]